MLEPRLYQAGFEELSTITPREANLLAASTEASAALTPVTGLTIDNTTESAATEAVTFLNKVLLIYKYKLRNKLNILENLKYSLFLKNEFSSANYYYIK
jgi:hypothetical protein